MAKTAIMKTCGLLVMLLVSVSGQACENLATDCEDYDISLCSDLSMYRFYMHRWCAAYCDTCPTVVVPAQPTDTPEARFGDYGKSGKGKSESGYKSGKSEYGYSGKSGKSNKKGKFTSSQFQVPETSQAHTTALALGGGGVLLAGIAGVMYKLKSSSSKYTTLPLEDASANPSLEATTMTPIIV